MEIEALMDAALVYGTGLGDTWSFLFTVILAAVGFLATLRQVFTSDHRSERRYRRLVFIVQVGLGAFMINGFVSLYDLFQRHNAVLAEIQARVRAAGESEALVLAFQPYAAMPEWLRECPADPPILCDLNLPISLIAYVVGGLLLLLLMPMIAGRERRRAEAPRT